MDKIVSMSCMIVFIYLFCRNYGIFVIFYHLQYLACGVINNFIHAIYSSLQYDIIIHQSHWMWKFEIERVLNYAWRKVSADEGKWAREAEYAQCSFMSDICHISFH